MDNETSPFQVNRACQVPCTKETDYIGRAGLEAKRAVIDEGRAPFKLKLVGLAMGGKPITEYAPDRLDGTPQAERNGDVTSPCWPPELGHDNALDYVPWTSSTIGTQFRVDVPEAYAEASGQPVEAEVVEVPLRPSASPSVRKRASCGRQELGVVSYG